MTSKEMQKLIIFSIKNCYNESIVGAIISIFGDYKNDNAQ